MEDQLKTLADNLSGDLVVSSEAKKKLKEFLTPESVVSLWQEECSAAALRDLLTEAQSVQNESVYEVVLTSLGNVFASETYGKSLLAADSANVLVTFTLEALASPNVGLAQPALAPSVALLQLLLTDAPGKAAEVGQIADSLFKNETVLRWFNCDELDCEANDISFRYLRQYTTLIDYLLDTTLTAFTEDILLLANFLTVCGVVCRMREVPAALSDAVGTGLQCQDELLYDLCCSFCTIVLKAHEANTTQFGSVWLEAFVKQTDPSRLSVYNTTLDTLGVYWSTKAGCDAVARSTINADWCTERLKGTTSNMTRLPLVRFIHYAATSTCAAAPFCDKALLTEVWKLSRNPEEEVRQCVWAIALGVTASPTLRPLMEQSYASYLCGHFEEDNRVIRQLQLDTARALCAQGNLPDAVKSRLRKFGEKGLYPPSSISVAAPRD